MPRSWTRQDLADLKAAKHLLEHPGFAARLSHLLGKPLESGIKFLPKNWQPKLAQATRAALTKGLELTLRTLKSGGEDGASNFVHKLMATSSGAVGGAFGFASMAVELPLTTCIILRSIADIARSEGHDLAEPETRLSCLTVLALGSPSPADDDAETGYWAVRSGLASVVTDAARHLAAGGGLKDAGAPMLVQLVNKVAVKFNVKVTQQAAAKAIPAIGAVAGGLINLAFIDHYQDMARGHFIVRRMEKRYGEDEVRKMYSQASVV